MPPTTTVSEWVVLECDNPREVVQELKKNRVSAVAIEITIPRRSEGVCASRKYLSELAEHFGYDPAALVSLGRTDLAHIELLAPKEEAGSRATPRARKAYIEATTRGARERLKEALRAARKRLADAAAHYRKHSQLPPETRLAAEALAAELSAHRERFAAQEKELAEADVEVRATKKSLEVNIPTGKGKNHVLRLAPGRAPALSDAKTGKPVSLPPEILMAVTSFIARHQFADAVTILTNHLGDE